MYCFALGQDDDALGSAIDAEKAAQRSLIIAEMKLQQGEGNITAVLIAEQAFQQARSTVIQARSSPPF